MHIFEQPDPSGGQNDSVTPPWAGEAGIPAPVASAAHLSKSDQLNRLVPAGSRWTPRDRRATHRAMGKH